MKGFRIIDAIWTVWRNVTGLAAGIALDIWISDVYSTLGSVGPVSRSVVGFRRILSS